jgi:hypothetical protein
MEKDTYTIEDIKHLVSFVLKDTPVVKAVLFGSYAKGEATPSSDIDIYIDSNGILDGFSFFGIYNILEEKLNKSVDLIEKIDLDDNSKIAEEIKKVVQPRIL